MNGVSEPDAFDMTDWSRWTQLLWAHFAQWLDSVFVVIVNGFILGLAAISGVIGYIVIDPMSAWILPRIVKPFKVPAKKDQKQQQNISSLISSWIQPNGSTTMIPPTSLVSASTPTLFQKFAERIKRDGRFVEQAVVEGICRVPNSVEAKARPPFNTAMAQLFLHLSALAYEHVDVVEHYAGLYGLKVETVSSSGCSGDDGVNARAAATVFYSVECNFVVLVFSGPSPLDISELLTSATIQKQKPGKDVLPGQIHETFWNALDFSPLDTKLSDKATFSSGTDNTCPLRISELLHVLEAKVLPQFDERKTTTNSSTAHHQHELVSKGFPFIWVTGHSLGAALATVVLAHLVHTRHSLVPFLKGCYTFGSPKCGDTEFATEVSKCCTASQVVMYRIVNANDIVPSFPIGTSCLSADSDSSSTLRRNRETDYKHVGVPVVLNYDFPLYTVGTARDLECIVKNGLWFLGTRFPASLVGFITGNVSLVGILQSGWPFPWEHLPSEYIKRLK